MWEAVYAMFDTYVDAGLAWLRKHGKEYIASVDNNLTASLALLLQVGPAAAAAEPVMGWPASERPVLKAWAEA